MWCIVNLPNGTQQAVKWDSKAIGQDCLEKVCKALGIICEMEYFGLEHWSPSRKETRTRQWINLRNRLSFDGCSNNSIQLMLALRVKFWVPVHFILQESVRNLFYMQAKSDLLSHRLRAFDWNNAAKLTALLCQADGMHFNELSLRSTCPIRIKREQQLLIQQQQQEKQQNQALQKQEKKEKDNVLSFKKRRLSKQKSYENIASPNLAVTQLPKCTPAVNVSTQPTTSSPSEPLSSISALTINLSTTSNTSSSTPVSPDRLNSSTDFTMLRNIDALEQCMSASPLRIYQDYIVRPPDEIGAQMPEDFLHKVAVEHGKLAQLKMTAKSAKYWLLQEIQELAGYGEEVFSGVTTTENSQRCDIAVGAHGITVRTGDEKNIIPFSAIAAAKSFRRTFKLEYVDDLNDRKDLEIKFLKHVFAAGLYRSITERHAFYVCDKVRGVVTNQFTRDLKGTIASMFKEDTELGKRYVFDIQRTCREVHDQARRILHERGIEITSQVTCGSDDIIPFVTKSTALVVGSSDVVEGDKTVADTISSWSGLSLSSGCFLAKKLDLAIREKAEREAVIERCVDTRISEAMTCKICMDRAINTMFNPCCHVMSCSECAMRCSNCPNCRVKITGAVKIYLPPELRTSQPGIISDSIDTKLHGESEDGQRSVTMGKASHPPSLSTPKITTTV